MEGKCFKMHEESREAKEKKEIKINWDRK